MRVWKRYKEVAREFREEGHISGRNVYRNAYWAAILVLLSYGMYTEITLGETSTAAYLAFWTGTMVYFASILYYYRKNKWVF